jgi:hypothetical protein
MIWNPAERGSGTPGPPVEDREDERQRHIRHWAVLMIMHLEGRDELGRRYGFVEALEHLSKLINRELQSVTDSVGDSTPR